LAVFGEKAFPIVLNSEGDVAIAGAEYGLVKCYCITRNFTHNGVTSARLHNDIIYNMYILSTDISSTNKFIY
jgi:hypothetical protein